MKFKLLGTAGAIPLPRPLCNCELCEKARLDSTLKRNSSCAFIEDINTLIDCPEDIGDSLNRHNITKVDNLLITHWHPDHTFGLRVLLEAKFNFIEDKPEKCINIYIGKKPYEILKKRFPVIEYMTEVLKVAKINIIEDQDELKFNNITVKVIGYSGKNSEWYGFLIQENTKKLLYVPCDTIHFETYANVTGVDVLIHECGIFSHNKLKTEISFPDMVKRIKKMQPKQAYLTHIEELELKEWGLEHLNKSAKEQDLKIAYDGLLIEL